MLVLPEMLTDTDIRRRVGSALCNEDTACRKQVMPRKLPPGGFGRVNGEVYWISTTRSRRSGLPILSSRFKAELEAEDAQRAQQLAEQERRRQESNARSRRDGEYPLTALGKTDPDFYLSSLAEKPLTFQSTNARGWNEWGRLGEVKVTCSQTPEGYWYVTIFAETIDSPVHHDAIPFARFYCHREYDIDIEELGDKSEASKSLNKQLAQAGFGVWSDTPEPKPEPPVTTPSKNDVTDVTDVRMIN